MRTAAEIRERALDGLQAMLLHPGMYGTGQSLEWAARAQLQDLAFIDARDAELVHEFDLLRAHGSFGQLGAWGALSGAYGVDSDYTDQLASVYARIAARLGYFAPARRMTGAEWERAREVEAWVTSAPRSIEDVERHFGAPSYKHSGQSPRVLGYAGPADDAWLYFDFSGGAEPARLDHVRLPRHPLRDAVIKLRSEPEHGASPEDTYRRFWMESLSGDRARILPFLVVHEDPALLWRGAYPADVASLLAKHYEQMDVVRVADVKGRVALCSDGCPVPLTMVRDGSRWRVDADPLLRILGATAPEHEQQGSS